VTSFTFSLQTLLKKVVTHREPGTTIALFRICLATVTLSSLWILRNEDVFAAIWFSSEHGGLEKLTTDHWLFQFLGGFSPRAVTTAYHLCALCAGLTLLGFGGSVSVLVCQQCYVALRALNEDASGGYDSLITVGLLLLALGRPTATLSLDCRLLRNSWTHAVLVPVWPRALLVFQLLLMYTVTGLQKIGYSWTPFGGYTAMHYVLNDPTWLRVELGDLPWKFDLVARLATLTTWHWEQLSFLLLFHWYYRFGNVDAQHWFAKLFRRWDLRIPWALVGAVMHLGIFLLLDVGPFSFASLSYYVCLWGPHTRHMTWLSVRAGSARVLHTPV
jgi:hypothetical protein